MIKKIVLSGYSGSGKTTLAKFIAKKNRATLIDLDIIAKKIMGENFAIINSIKKEFGIDYISNNKIIFSKLSRLVFSDINKLKKLNSIVHPILKDYLIQNLKQSSKNIVIDAAIIPLWKIERLFTERYWIESDFNLRLKRVAHKTGLPKYEIDNRLKSQEILFSPPDSNVWSYINNNGSVKKLFDLAFNDLS